MKIKEEKIDEKFNVIEFESEAVSPDSLDKYVELFKKGQVSSFIIAIRTCDRLTWTSYDGTPFETAALTKIIEVEVDGWISEQHISLNDR